MVPAKRSCDKVSVKQRLDLIPNEELGYNIVRVDSTMVAETANKLEKAMQVGCKKQVKYTLCLDDLLPGSVQVFRDKKHLNEGHTAPVTILKLIGPSPGTVFVFDRGVQSRKAYEGITDKQWQFVTRLKENTKYHVLKELPVTQGLQVGNLLVESDDWVHLYHGNNQKTKQPFRLLKTKNGQGKAILFLSNIKDIPAEDIIMVYKKRWGIEVFFRFLKQELNFSHLIPANSNGIKIILYMTLILSMLVNIYKKYNQTGFKTAKRRVKMELDDLLTILIVQACGGNPNIVFPSP